MSETPALFSDTARRLRLPIRTNLLLEAEALARGCSTTRVGSRAFVAGTSAQPHLFGFQGTLSLETSRSAVRAADDRLMRKLHLADHGIPVPASRTFSFSQTEEAVAYAQSFRRGALIKPVDRTTGSVRRRPAVDAPAVLAEVEQWRQKLPGRSRLLVERRVFGPEYLFYVAGDQVLSVVRRRGRRWDHEIYRHEQHEQHEPTVHPEVLELAIQTLAAFPRTPHGTVRMICPQIATSASRGVVVSAGPDVSFMGSRPPASWSTAIAGGIIDHAGRRAPQTQPLTPRSMDPVPARFTLTELTDAHAMGESVRAWAVAQNLELSGVEISSRTTADRTVSGTLVADPQTLALFSGLCATRRLGGQVPQTITLHQEEPTS